MKSFLVWLALTLGAFGGLGGGYHLALESAPRRVLVIVDSSFAMKPVWHRVSPLLRELGKRKYSEFSLVTEKGGVHGWASRLSPGKLAPYAPRDFAALEGGGRFPEIDEAGEVYLITNAPAGETADFGDWTVLRP
jgi:hypothetical protein